MINARPGYWDVESASWVGVDPMYVAPPLRHAEHAHDRAIGDLPEQRSDEVLLEPETPASA